MKKAIRWSFLLVATGLLVWAIAASWPEFTSALADLTWHAVAGALVASVAALVVNAMSWRAVMRAVGLQAHIGESMRVFLVSQVGKYVPGSVWPILVQAEFARDHGVSRARAATGSIVAMVVGVVTAAVVGVLGLALSTPTALGEYWWVILVGALLASLLVPPVLKRIVALAFRLTRRSEHPVHIGTAALAASAAWSVAMWLLLGLHAWLLLTQINAELSFAAVAGAFAFAWLVGFLVIIAPAGAGAREAALVIALSASMEPGQALGFAIVSRFLMTAADAIGLAIGVGVAAARRRRAESV